MHYMEVMISGRTYKSKQYRIKHKIKFIMPHTLSKFVYTNNVIVKAKRHCFIIGKLGKAHYVY